MRQKFLNKNVNEKKRLEISSDWDCTVKKEIELCFLISDEVRCVICALRIYLHTAIQNNNSALNVEGELPPLLWSIILINQLLEQSDK